MLPETYDQALDYLFRRINFERISGADYSLGDLRLDRMRLLLDRLGNPHLAVPAIHLAGTKGKGSTAAMVASILTEAGYRVGLYTSPHLNTFEERFTVDGALPTHVEIVALMRQLIPVIEELDRQGASVSPTFFEIVTALAWLHFVNRECDVAVLEVGLGGRLDATNVCRPLVTAITTISRDHTRQLGATVDRIAAEKAGIVKPGIPCVTGETKPVPLAVIAATCRDQASPLVRLGKEFFCDWQPEAVVDSQPGSLPADQFSYRDASTLLPDLRIAFLGEHQARNAATAVAIVQQLITLGWTVPDSAIRTGLARVRWPARIEPVASRPLVIVDAGHNWAAVAALVTTLRDRIVARRRLLIFAATRDKDVPGLLGQLLPEFQTIILTEYQTNPRALPLAELARMAEPLGRPVHLAAQPDQAWQVARQLAGPDDLICVTGSFFIAAELRELILAESR
jgi:dihydrofolate synthase / folylpolyglutamate synthase